MTISGNESINTSRIKTELGVKSFARRIRQSVYDIANSLQDYLDDTDQETVHEIRIAIRKFTISAMLLPKKIRSRPRTHRFIVKSVELSRISTEIRDFDIIANKLSEFNHETTGSLIEKLKAERDLTLAEARELALSLAEETLPVLRTKDVSRKKLQKKFDKKTEKIANRIMRRLPKVVSNPEQIEELHSLRKDCKRLRYLLELAPNDEDAQREIAILHDWQDILGSIRDDDVTIKFLRCNMHNHPVADLLYNITAGRNKKYDRFVGQWRTNQQSEQLKPQLPSDPLGQVEKIQDYA